MFKAANDPGEVQETSGLRILFVGTQMALGGAQRLLLDQARWFHEHGHAVTAAFYYDKQDLASVWKERVPFRLLTLSRLGSGGTFLDKLAGTMIGEARLLRLLRRGRFNVVVTFTYDSNLLALPLAWLAGVPARIATHHGIIEGFPRLAERLHSFLVNAGMASVLVNVSRKVLEQSAAAGIRREHMTVIPNGIPTSSTVQVDRDALRAELGFDHDDMVVISVGRLVYQKGHEYLIEAIGRLSRSHPQLRLIICGEGPLRGRLETQIQQLGLAARAKLLGNRLDIGRFLGGADIFALPSRWEGMPVALLEAMDCSLPIVATRVEGVEEVIQHGLNGLLVPPEDARALTDSLKILTEDPQLRSRIAHGANDRLREAYTVDVMCDRYLTLMRKLQPIGAAGRAS